MRSETAGECSDPVVDVRRSDGADRPVAPVGEYVLVSPLEVGVSSRLTHAPARPPQPVRDFEWHLPVFASHVRASVEVGLNLGFSLQGSLRGSTGCSALEPLCALTPVPLAVAQVPTVRPVTQTRHGSVLADLDDTLATKMSNS